MAVSAEDRALQAELSEARFAILRQLELLAAPAAPWRDRRPDSRAIVIRLKAQLAEIEDALASLAEQG
ncbi:MAG: hypothetical protein ACXU82_21340 [Caulobacteraceae bacterium]